MTAKPGNRAYYLCLALMLAAVSGCTDRGQDGNEEFAVPDYSIINAPSDDPDRPWYLSNFFKRSEGWKPEVEVDLDDLRLGMYELTQYPNEPPTEEQVQAAVKLVNDSFDAARRNGWFNKEKGLADGYQPMFKDPVHFGNVDYVFDGETLNPEKPEVLMYYSTDEGDFLMGVMYIAVGERGPQVGGSVSVWHYHIDRRVCYERGVFPIGRINEDGTCDEGVTNTRSPEMLHIWFFNHPDGRFSTRMGLSDEVIEIGVEELRQVHLEQN